MLDIRYALKLLVKNPTFTIVAVLTLALGIGATTAIFSVMNAAMLRPLPFPDPGQVVFIYEVNQDQGAQTVPTAATLLAWKANSQSIEAVGAVNGLTEFSLSGERVRFGQMDIDTFRLLGVQPLLGRWYRDDDPIVGETAEPIVISYGLWQRRFGGDPNILGQKLPNWSAGWGTTIIGVMPRGFWVAPFMADADAWNAIDSRRIPPGARRPTLARLKPGVTYDQAETELTSLMRGADEGNADIANWSVELEPFQETLSENYSQVLYMLLGAVGFVLLIACANVVNLQLSRAVSRETEMATRAAIGAGRRRLMRQLLVENVVLGLLGGSLGILVALLGIRLFIILAPNFYPPTEEITLDSTVLLFTLGISVLAGLLFGIVPALRASRPDLNGALKQASRGSSSGGRQRIRQTLVVSEVALALVLLIGAGLMMNSYVRVLGVDVGFEPDNLLTMEMDLAGLERYRVIHNLANDYEVLPESDRLFREVLDRIRRLPGVDSVGLASMLPPDTGISFPFGVVGHAEDDRAIALYHEVSPDFFSTMRIAMDRGRAFNDLDTGNAPAVAIVNQTLARQFFEGEDPIGQTLQVQVNQGNPELENDPPRQIVGIVEDNRLRLQSEPQPMIFIPYLQHLDHYAGSTPAYTDIHKEFAIRTSAAAAADIGVSVREAVAAVDPVVAVDQMMPMRLRLSQSASNEQFLMRLLGTFAVLGVFLAGMGIYGVISYSVAQRRHEFGIRTALGAGKRDIVWLVLREALVVTAVGSGVGILAAFGLTRLIASQLFDVSPMDPLTILSVAALLFAVALLASWVPGRQAARQSPLVALRVE